jgi:Flp pilus assembly protein TadG
MRGLYTVEFAISGTALLILVFGCIELCRASYTLASLQEGTRRAARLATVCPVGDQAISSAVNFMGAYGFTSSNVQLSYLDVNGNSLGSGPNFSSINFSSIYYVQVGVVNYTIPLSIPFMSAVVTSPSFAVTLPSQSLGLDNTGASTAC